ncbi:hypothetical protein M8818_002634 [Zalaria obscura]|uniref:Uncharacterized protein n=1 Tax=Zalaria obscura TaxID=2024903 RepID=A0ACC3SH03_9PEZI
MSVCASRKCEDYDRIEEKECIENASQPFLATCSSVRIVSDATLKDQGPRVDSSHAFSSVRWRFKDRSLRLSDNQRHQRRAGIPSAHLRDSLSDQSAQFIKFEDGDEGNGRNCEQMDIEYRGSSKGKRSHAGLGGIAVVLAD